MNIIEKYYYGYYEINDKKVAKYYNILVKELKLGIPYIGKFYYVNDIASLLIEEGIKEIIDEYVIWDAKNHLKEIKDKIEEYDPLILASSSLCLSIRDSIISKISSKYKIPYRSIRKNVRSIEDILEKNGYYKEIEEEEEIKEKIIEEEKEKEIKKEEKIKEKIEIPPYFILFIVFLIVYVILFLLHFLKIL
jgi:Fe2+ transport system protein B